MWWASQFELFPSINNHSGSLDQLLMVALTINIPNRIERFLNKIVGLYFGGYEPKWIVCFCAATYFLYCIKIGKESESPNALKSEQIVLFDRFGLIC